MKSTEALPIKGSELARFLEPATQYLSKVEWAPQKSGVPAQPVSATAYRPSSVTVGGPEQVKVSLVEIARTLAKDPLLLPQDLNFLLLSLRKGLTIGMHLADLYQKHSGLSDLIDRNRTGVLSDVDKTAFRSKQQTAAAVMAFATSYYVVWSLTRYRTDEVGKAKVECGGIPELALRGAVDATRCLLFHFGRALQNGASTGLEAIKMALLYFGKAIEELKLYKLDYTEPFTSLQYRLEDEEFSITGFEAVLGSGAASVSFNRVAYTQIVGNRDAIHKSRRIIQRICVGYNPKDQKNPFQELGGIPRVRMGKGIPGTGKSLLIAANATYFQDLCTHLGRPFLFSPLPDTVVSTFQGGSAERMVDWMKPFLDPSRISYGPLDDAENVFEDRSRQGVSAGVREVISVFLRYTEGAYAVDRGANLLDIMTNLPEQLDPAVLSRVQERFDVDGARERPDFLDQDYLWHTKLNGYSPGFVNMEAPKHYEWLSAQKELKNLSELHRERAEPVTETLARIFDEVRSEFSGKEHDFFAELYVRVRQKFPFFSSRDVRNIQRAISARLMDFDMPDAWFEKSDVFADQDYDRRKTMVVDLMKQNMKGLSFADIRMEETMRYLNVMVSIPDNAHQRRVRERAEELRVMKDAEEFLSKEG